MALDIQNCLLRIVALYKECFATIPNAQTLDGVPYYFHTQEGFAYLTTRISTIDLEDTEEGGDDDYGEAEEVQRYDIITRLVVMHATGGVDGEYEDKLSVYIPNIISYFNARELLQSAAYPTAPNNLLQARIVSCTGLAFFEELGKRQMGAEFTHRLKFTEYVEQIYL